MAVVHRNIWNSDAADRNYWWHLELVDLTTFEGKSFRRIQMPAKKKAAKKKKH
jgi:hypothetical protein